MAWLGSLPALKATQLCQIFVKLKSMSDELPAIALVYEITKKVIVLNTTLDKHYRYSLGELAIKNCFDVLEQLMGAKQAPKPLKKSYLVMASAKAEVLTLQLRAILELKLANETNVLRIQAKLTEAKRQLGGWRNSLN